MGFLERLRVNGRATRVKKHLTIYRRFLTKWIEVVRGGCDHQLYGVRASSRRGRSGLGRNRVNCSCAGGSETGVRNVSMNAEHFYIRSCEVAE